MSLSPGTRLGHYNITSLLGEGGMGQVWQATDTQLNRQVALKILPDAFADDPGRLARFTREAQILASLNHPHICTLFDVGEHEGTNFLVMEFLEGETLAQRLKKGALPLDQALKVAVEIADALDKAHRQGITHRDLKPGNIMLTKAGAKLLDFGLAKLRKPGTLGAEGVSTATTQSEPLTGEGAILGTLQYMAPEQLEGKEVDARTDIFAFGATAYEMVTGNRAFAGSSSAGLIADIMTANPPSVRELQPTAPPFLDHLLGRCLAKDPENRWHSALDLASELRWLAGPGADPTGAPLQPSPPPAPPAPRPSDYRIEYFASQDGSSVAAARGGRGRPLLVIPNMVDTIETSWGIYAEAFSDREVILYDRRGTGLSERDSLTGDPEPYLQDGQAVVDGFRLEDFDLVATLLGTVEASSLAARNADRVGSLVLRSPVIGMADWAMIPAMRAALAAMEHDWDYFVESFAQLVIGWGNPKGRLLAARYRAITTRDELRATLEAFRKLDLGPVFPEIQASTLVEHHPAYFFPDTYSRRIASLIEPCQMAVFSGADDEFMYDFSIARAFLSATGSP